MIVILLSLCPLTCDLLLDLRYVEYVIFSNLDIHLKNLICIQLDLFITKKFKMFIDSRFHCFLSGLKP